MHDLMDHCTLYSYTEGELSSVLTTGDGENFESLPDLPNPVYYNCLAVIDDDKIFTCGGREEQGFTTVSEAYMFSKLTSSWTRYIAVHLVEDSLSLTLQ